MDGRAQAKDLFAFNFNWFTLCLTMFRGVSIIYLFILDVIWLLTSQ